MTKELFEVSINFPKEGQALGSLYNLHDNKAFQCQFIHIGTCINSPNQIFVCHKSMLACVLSKYFLDKLQCVVIIEVLSGRRYMFLCL